MRCHINVPEPQALNIEWFGGQVEPPWRFRFSTEEGCLVFRAARAAAPRVAPQARPGAFTKNLWRFDTAEFFIANPEGTRYMEFNLAPNGAWWAAVFSKPRVPDPVFGVPEGISSRARCVGAGWEAELRVPLAPLAAMGIAPAACRLAAAAIVSHEDDSYTFLTTAAPCEGRPDFHHPERWTAPLLS